MIEIEERGESVRFRVRAQPRASRDEVAGEHDGAVRIRVAAPPVEGKANQAMIEFLAGVFGVPRSAVRILSGATGRSKLVEVDGTDAETARRLLGPP